MNFLAHSFLTPQPDAWLTGNMVADLIKKRDIHLLDDDVQLGIYLHYEIDTFTDSNQFVTKATRLLHPTQGKYSPVGTDLIWDLCLAKQWSTYTDKSLEKYITEVYAHLTTAVDHLETKLADKLTYLINKDFLTSYTQPVSMKIICEKIDARTRFKSNLVHLVDDYLSLETEFNEIFAAYFPQVILEIEGWKTNILSNHHTNDSNNELIKE